MRRPGLWVANGHPGNTASAMLSWRPAAITCFYDYLGFNNIFNYKAANPDVQIIVRFQHPLNWQKDPNFYARQLGEQVASKWNDLKRLDPYVYFANEMNLHYENGDQNAGNQAQYTTPQFYQKYAGWVRMTAEVIKNIVPEMKLVTPPFAFGHHEDGAPDNNGVPTEGWAGYDYLYETVRDYFDNILTFHSYWGHGGGSVRDWLYNPELSSWYAFRWRRVLKLFENRYNIKARMIIDEAGNFGAADPDFTDQIMYHAHQCLSDARVLAVTYFLWLDPTNSPGNLPNSWAQKVLNLSDHLNRLKNMPEVPVTTGGEETQTTIRVLFDDGTVRTMPVEEYLRAVVPAEIPALWHAEAVKAQAVASRSYAQYAIKNPRHPNADICTNPAHCQNYDPGRIHPKSDEAIQATRGIVARYNGETINALFSANCGGHTLGNEDVFGGSPLPYLRGVPCPDKGEKRGHGVGFCQYGARAFAGQGRTFEQIIKHYYTGVTLGQPTAIRTSTIYGTILNSTGQPVPNVRIILSGQGQQAEMTSRPDGTYRFSNVPAGTYQLELPDFQLRQQNISPVPGQDLKLDLTLPVSPGVTVTVKITRGPGLPLIVGDWGKPNVPLIFTTPAGKRYQIMTGSKPEFGPGGFEIYTDQTGAYLLDIENQRFQVPMNGQFTRLTFQRVTTPQPAGIIEGTLQDNLNRPVANRRIYLTGGPINLANTTNQAGQFRFENLPAGNYTITVEGSDFSQAVTSNGQNKVTVSLKLAAQWAVKVERGQGLPLLVGDIGVANQTITITTPSGAQTQVISGSKPEWGAGGFEIYATTPGNYIVQFLGQSFTIPMTGQFTKATFRKEGDLPDEQVRLVSVVLPRSRAEAIFKSELEADPDTRGLFEIQIIKS